MPTRQDGLDGGAPAIGGGGEPLGLPSGVGARARWLVVLVATGTAAVDAMWGGDLSRSDLLALPLDAVRCFACVGLVTLLLIAAMPSGMARSRRVLLGAGCGAVGVAVWSVCRASMQGVWDASWLVVAMGAVVWVGAVCWSGRSGGWMAIVWGARVGLALACLRFVMDSIDRDQVPPGWLYHWPHWQVHGKLDKSIHAYAGFGMVLLGLCARPLGMRIAWWWSTVVVTVFFLASQPLMEMVQASFGRRSEWLDVVAHSLGVAGALVVYLVGRLIAACVRRRRADSGGAP